MADDATELIALQDVLGASKWSRALFTTYSLSLGFFEAYLLPRLEAVGCSDITILVDSEFYLESLSERQARWTGKAYRLLPIGRPGNHIFHPKLTYLWANEGDVVAIGSGNLTYAGHGGNLECLECISSKEEGAVFAEVGDFFRALVDSDVVASEETRAILRNFQARAGDVARRSAANRNESPARVFHTLTRSIQDQLVETLAPYGKFRRITVVSPFHTEDGETSLRLASELRATHVDFCLDPATKGTPLPYKTLRKTHPEVSYVLPAWEESRPLHAKWYEFEGTTCFRLTGSVNATETSFASTSNVEVAVLRPYSPARESRWIEATPKLTIRPEFSAGNSTYQGWLTGHLAEEGTLAGHIFGISAAAGIWSGELHVDLKRVRLPPITISSDGTFKITGANEFVEPDAAVQLQLRRGAERAAGWISLEHLLRATGEGRGARLALSRLSHGGALRGDIDRVIHWLTEFIQSRVGEPMPPARSGKSAPAVPPGGGARRVGYEEWAAGDSHVRALGHNVGSLLQRALEVLARGNRLEHHPRNANGTGGNGNGEEMDDIPDDSGPTPDEFDRLEEFWRFISIVLEEHPQLPIATDLLEYRAEHAVHCGFGTPELLAARCIEWLRLAERVPFSDTQREIIAPVFSAMAGLVQFLSTGDRADASAAELRQLMERFLQRPIDDGIAALALEGFEHRAFSILVGQLKVDAVAALAKVVSTKTIRDELTEFIEIARSGSRPVPSPNLRQTLGDAILSEIFSRRRDKNPFANADSTAIAACPACRASVDASERTELRGKRAIRCRGCGRAIVWLGA